MFALTATVTKTATKPAIAIPPIKMAAVQLPEQAVYGAVIAGLAFVLFILLIIYIVRKMPKKKEAKLLTPEEMQAKHIKDLKDALVKELRGTSKQNWIMIILTVVFIAVTIFGGSILLVFSRIPSLAAQTAGFFRSLVGR